MKDGKDDTGASVTRRAMFQPQPLTPKQRRASSDVLLELRERDARRAAADAAMSELEGEILAIRERLESIDEDASPTAASSADEVGLDGGDSGRSNEEEGLEEGGDAAVVASERAVKRAKLEGVLNELDAWLNPGYDEEDAQNGDGAPNHSARPTRAGEVRAAHRRLTDVAEAYYDLLPKAAEQEPEQGESDDDDVSSASSASDGGSGGRAGGQALTLRLATLEDRVTRLEALLEMCKCGGGEGVGGLAASQASQARDEL